VLGGGFPLESVLSRCNKLNKCHLNKNLCKILR